MRPLGIVVTVASVLAAGVQIGGTAPAHAHEQTHVVRPGENLTVIARRYGVPIRTLAQANDIADQNLIFAGRNLKIPGSTTSYRVGPGDTLSAIAVRHGVSVEALALANGISNPDILWAGRTLKVPGPSGSGGGVRAASASSSVPASRAHLRPIFEHWAAEAGVPADLAMAVAWQESGWQQHVVSSTGAVGVMQLMPDTVDFVSRVLLRRRSALDARDVEQNIRMGTRHLRYLLDQTGNDLHLAVAAYYQGLGAVRRHGIYEQSRPFVANVLALRSRFAG